MDFYVLLFEDEGSYGVSQPMSKKDCVIALDEAKASGYNIISLSLKTAFSSDRKLVPVERF